MISVALATAAEWTEVLPLVSAPQGDGWGLATHYPQGLAAGLPRERQHLAIVRQDRRLIACGLRSVRQVRSGGGTAYLGYLTLLRRDPTIPPTQLLPCLRETFACLATTRRSDELPVDLTSILAGNRAARRLLEAGLPGVPRYQHRATYRTFTWSARTLARLATAAVRRDHIVPLPHPGLSMQPDAAPSGMLHHLDERAWGSVVDQRDHKAIVITTMPPSVRWLRSLLNGLRQVQRLPRIPRPGAVIPQVFLTSWGWAPGAVREAFAVAGTLARQLPSTTLVTAGWCDDHPDAAALAHLAPPAEQLVARWYTVGGTLPPGPWHLEAGGL